MVNSAVVDEQRQQPGKSFHSTTIAAVLKVT